MPFKDNTNDSYQPNLNELIPISKAAKISGLSQSFIRRLVSQGDIWGMKVGRNWVTTEQAIREYLARDRRRGPKPKKKQ